jgi:3-isopropylmalate/(R)-2-methylmalate dehydratase small subunit
VLARVGGPAIVLPGDDIDTDRIMPARFLRAVTFEGLEAHVFADDRLAASERGEVHPFDAPGAARARVLVVGSNFGCGSSREHAPQALLRWGIGAVVGESFAEIFFANAQAIGLPCVALAPADLAALRRLAAGAGGPAVFVDIARGVVEAADAAFPLQIAEPARAAFLSGDWDVTGRLLEGEVKIAATAARLPYLSDFVGPG